MRIKEIKIEGLFGMFNHTIPMHDDHLTIIYGENGIGKTMIFKILKDFFKKTNIGVSFFHEHCIELIEITFDDNSFVKIEQVEQYELLWTGIEIQPLPVYFIETQRLIYVQKNLNILLSMGLEKRPLEESDITFSIESIVTQYASELSTIFKNKNAAYQALSDELKNSQNKRLVNGQINKNLSDSDFKNLVAEIESRRDALQKLGVLKNGVERIEIPTDDFIRAILAVNMQDVLTQLKLYDEDNFYARVRLFVEILNERRLSYKQIILFEKDGFIFKNDNGEILKPEQLSSGEQHEVSLLYQLLFKIPENSLVLIDEPEISLHVAWQMEFLEDMQDIIKLRGFDIMIATHSPSIINGNWKLTVSLKGGNDEK